MLAVTAALLNILLMASPGSKSGLEAGLSVVTASKETNLFVYRGANVARCLQIYDLRLPKGKSLVKLSLASIPISREAVEISFPNARDKIKIGRTHPPDLPDSVLLELEATAPGDYRAEVGYYIAGLDWQVTYTLYEDEKAGQAFLGGYAQVLNRTGRPFNQAKITLAILTREMLEEILKLMPPERAKAERAAVPAADQFELAPGMPGLGGLGGLGGAPGPPVPAVPSLEAVSVGEYWELPLPDLHNLPPRGEVALIILSAPSLKGELVATFGQAAKRSSVKYLEFTNDKDHGLPGKPLLPGNIFAAIKGVSGAYFWVPSEPVEYQAPGAKVRLNLGNASDIVYERKVLKYSVENQRYETNRGILFDAEKSVEISLRNAYSFEIRIELAERIYLGAEVIENSHPYERPSADSLLFKIPLKPAAKETIKYRIKYSSVSPVHPIINEISAMEVAE